MTKRARQSLRQRLEAEAAAGAFGPNGAAVAATPARVAELDDVDIKRLADAQKLVGGLGIRFFEAWHGVHERAPGARICWRSSIR